MKKEEKLMKIKMKKIILDVDNREIALSYINGGIMITGDEQVISALSKNERDGLKESAENLLLTEFGDDI